MTGAAGFRLSPQQARLCAAGWGSVRARVEAEVEGPLDPVRLRAAVALVAARHESLRTEFVRPPGLALPLQVVSDAPAGVDFEAPGVATGPGLAVRLRADGPDRHRLVITLPALAADARSLARVIGEIADAYRGVPPAGEPTQYPDYAEWRARVEGEAAAPRRLPEPFLRTPEDERRIERVAVSELPAGSEVDAAAARAGSRGSDFLLACWQALLLRWTGECVEVARVVEGREDAGDGAGLYAEASLAPDPPSPDFPLARLAALHGSARPLRAQFLGVGELPRVAFEAGALPEPVEAEGIRIAIVDVASPSYPADLKLVCRREDRRWAARIEYCRGAIEPGEAASLADAWSALVHGAVSEPSARIAELPITSASARRRVLVDFQRPPSPIPALLARELFETQADRHPERTAVASARGDVTYRELDERAERIAGVLRGFGAGRGKLVGIGAGPSAQALAAILGIWKAGAAYVALNSEQPPARLARQWFASGADLCLVDAAAASRFAFLGGRALRLDDAGFEGVPGSARRHPEPAIPEDLAYAIFTSGSSGEPKLVGIRHRSLVNYAMFVWQELLGGDEGLCFATPASLAADLGHTAIYGALASGGTLAIVPPEAVADAGLFADFVRERNVDVLKIVPSHLAALLAGAGPAVLPRRLVISGGEALRAELAEAIIASGCRLVNHYGPTETTIGALTRRVEGVTPGSANVPIGRTIPSVRAYVLDERRRLLPPGAAGELWIGGAGVAAGYLRQPRETAERFVEDPFDPAGGTLYRTGDRARFLSDGAVEFLGRLDDQWKVRGHRIEAGEVVAALLRHPAVGDAAVAGLAGPAGETELVAYVVARASRPPGSALRGFLEGEVPEAAVPSRFVFVDAIPRTPAGKLDRTRLVEIRAPGRPRQRPRNPVEEWIAGVWMEAMGLADVGVDDDFFELGGHSLLATRVMARLCKELPVRLPMMTIFRHRTVADLAEAVAAACEAVPSAAGGLR